MTDKKEFFEERSAGEIAKLNVGLQRFGRGLVDSIFGLNDATEGIVITGRILPDKFYAGGFNSADAAARKAYKHGDYLAFWQPQTRAEAIEGKMMPSHSLRMAIDKIAGMPEEDIFYIGTSFRPVQGKGRRKFIPFVWQFEGPKIFAYAETMASGIELKSYDDAERVGREGASVVCKVPSRTRGESKYALRLDHVPVKSTPESPAIIWGLESRFSAAPMHSVFNIRYTYNDWSEGSDVHTFYPHDIAAYLAVAKAYAYGSAGLQKSMTPLQSNPFIVPSRLAVDFYSKLCNNVLVEDRDGKREHVRKPYVAEKCVLLGRMMGVLGRGLALHAPQDGSLNDYDWGNKRNEAVAVA